MSRFIILLSLPLILFSQTILRFSSEGMSLKLDEVTSLDGAVWGMDFITKDRIILTLKDGRIAIFDLEKNSITFMLNTPNVINQGQGGLLDVAISPNFSSDKLIYFTYSKSSKDSVVTTLARAEFKNNELYNWEDLLITKSSTNTSRHFGSRITFDKSGYLYFSVGDRGVRDNAQNLTNHAGSIIRLNLDGTTPNDNPFVKSKDKLIQIYSFGHRNPQGLFYDKTRDILFSCEHGPRGGDEINIINKGQNYGWPIVSYGKEYWNPLFVGEAREKKGMVNPIKQYTPSIAPSSLLVYSGNKFPKWKGDIFIGALKLTHLNRVVLDKSMKPIKEEILFNNMNQRVRDVVQSPDGFIYLSTDSGKIYRVLPN